MEKVKKADNPWYYYLNSRLIKERKPCMPGDYIHLKSFSGCFRVHAVKINCFTVLKNREPIEYPWAQFRCLKGRGESEETILRKELKSLIDTVNVSISTQTIMNNILKDELKNLRKTFV